MKAALGPNRETQDASNLIVKICNLLAGWVGHKDYRDLLLADVPPLDERYRAETRHSGQRVDGEARSKELLVIDIQNYVTANGAENTFLTEDVDMYLVVNHAVKLCTKVYVFPKYQLRFGHERRSEMEKVFKLFIASTADEWNLAFGPYDFDEHFLLWGSFCVVCLLSDGSVVDEHPEFLKQTMTSQQLYVMGLHNERELRPLRGGPRSSRPARVTKKDKRPDSIKQAIARSKDLHRSPTIPLPSHAAPASISQDLAGSSVVPRGAAQSSSEAPPVYSAVVPGKCMARKWGNGQLPQCGIRATKGDYCYLHAKCLTHGRIDQTGQEQSLQETYG